MVSAYVPALCGFAFYQAFCYLAFESPTILDALGLHEALAQPLFFACSLCGQIGAYGVIALVALTRRNRSFPEPGHGLAACLAASGFALTWVSCVLHGYAPDGAALPWFAVGGAALGAGAALVNLLWARVSCGIGSPRRLYVFVLSSNLLSLAAYLAATHLPHGWAAPCGAALLLASIACAAYTRTRPHATGSGNDAPLPAGARDGGRVRPALVSLWRPVLAVVVLAFVAGLMLQLPHIRDVELGHFQGVAFMSQAVVVGILALPALVSRRAPNFEGLFKLALALSAAGFALLPLVWSGGEGIENACAQLGLGIASMFLWCMLAQTARDGRIPAEGVYATALASVALARLLGTLLAVRFQEELGGGTVLTGVALAAVYLVAMVPMFLFKSRRPPEKPGAPTDLGKTVHAAAPTPETAPDRIALSCAALADRHGLTPRELEMLQELAQGRTLHAIADKQGVSENTVKYHVRGIYQKCGVHTRDELIDLVGC